ncbi:Uncharacterized protein Fot_26286 [Forsythia ovata]|uniref:30S ribosomal protein 3, chloroplastic n=1 Tax=Forsythia ovata TaxID=205694 RepID=A0ABD1UCW2_9LAMI
MNEGHGTIPLSPYYFWPRKDACEELKVMLDRKPWISNKHTVGLLNQSAHIINLWQHTTGTFNYPIQTALGPSSVVSRSECRIGPSFKTMFTPREVFAIVRGEDSRRNVVQESHPQKGSTM